MAKPSQTIIEAANDCRRHDQEGEPFADKSQVCCALTDKTLSDQGRADAVEKFDEACKLD